MNKVDQFMDEWCRFTVLVYIVYSLIS